MHKASLEVGPIRAKGAVTVDFALPGDLPLEPVIQVIERDRTHMAARPGFQQKHLPIRPDSATGNLLSGGRYLFDSVEHAEQYRSWAENDFVLDGIKFFERPVFIDPVAIVWRVVGGYHWTDGASHALIRFERWRMRPGSQCDLESAWPSIRAEAERRGLVGAWLLHNGSEHLAGLVTIAQRSEPVDLQNPQACLQSLELSPSLATMLEEPVWAKEFDRTSFVLTIWLPFEEGQPALWPNSPPMPAPPAAATAR